MYIKQLIISIGFFLTFFMHDVTVAFGCTGNCENGYGKYVYLNGTYEGTFSNGEQVKGTYFWYSGDTFTGDFKNGEPFFGTYTSIDGGLSYTGKLVNGYMSGFGKVTMNDGSIYEGELFESKMQGYGILTMSTGDVYEGDFFNGKIHGYGLITMKDGKKVEGYFSNNSQDGYGVKSFSNGVTYESGIWENGTLITPDPIDDLTSHQELSEATRLFDWAEKNYPNFFTAGEYTFKTDGYLARYFSQNDTYIGIKNNQVYVYGEVFGGILEVGPLSNYLDMISH